MRVLVAGASGAIGRPLVTALLARGHTVITLSRPGVWSSGTRGLTEVSADVLAADDLLRALSGEGVGGNGWSGQDRRSSR